MEDINYKELIEDFWLNKKIKDWKYHEYLNNDFGEQIGMSHQELIDEERAAYNLPPEKSDPSFEDLYDL